MRSAPLLVLGLSVALVGCNAARTPQPVAVAPVRTTTPAEFHLPEGVGCAGAIARYQAVIDNDLATGHVNQGVHAQINSEIGDAAAACSAGQDGRALTLLRASKSRHGYPG